MNRSDTLFIGALVLGGAAAMFAGAHYLSNSGADTIEATDDSNSADADSPDDAGDAEAAAADAPLAAMMGWNIEPVEQRRRQLEIEERVAECMGRDGWKYTPVDYAATQPTGEDALRWEDPDTWGAKYGYGVMYDYELYEMATEPSEGSSGTAAVATVPGVVFTDPNQEYFDGLSTDERDSYERALYGLGTEAGGYEVTTAEIVAGGDFPEGIVGCRREATALVIGNRPSDDPAVVEMVGELQMQLEEDPRLADAIKAWSDCLEPIVAEHGLDAPTTEWEMGQIVNRLKAEALDLREVEVTSYEQLDEMYTESDPQNRPDDVVYNAFVDQDGQGLAYLGKPKTLDGDEIDRLAATELDLWKADQACRKEVDLAGVRRTLELEVVDGLVAAFPQLDG